MVPYIVCQRSLTKIFGKDEMQFHPAKRIAVKLNWRKSLTCVNLLLCYVYS